MGVPVGVGASEIMEPSIDAGISPELPPQGSEPDDNHCHLRSFPGRSRLGDPELAGQRPGRHHRLDSSHERGGDDSGQGSPPSAGNGCPISPPARAIEDLVDPKIRLVAREFTNSVRDGLVYTMPEELRQEYMPLGRHKDDGIFCLQMNARKDGRLFRNMFYLRAISLNDKPYIIGLQTEIPEGADYDVYHEACERPNL